MRLRSGLTATGLAGVLITTAAAPAAAAPATDYEMPFPCKQEWYGSTRSGHSPSYWSVDWNRTDDLGAPVLAAGAGVVSRVENLGGSSYGLFVFIDHGSDESTVYAHLSAEYVSVGQHVDQGELVGRLGTSGNSTGPHLHFEERLDGRDIAPWFHDRAFDMNSWETSRNCVDTPIAGDWNGDGVAQIGLFRRARHAKFRLAWGPEVRKVLYGDSVDTPLVGDWDGNGVSDLGVRRGGSSTFTLRGPEETSTTLDYGDASDRGVAGDWNRDGVTDIGVWRASEAAFYLRYPSGRSRRVPLGSSSSQPVTGDWNGDGRTDVGVFSGGSWTLQVLHRRDTGWQGSIALGTWGDLPLTGDWNGDGATDLGTWTPSTAEFVLRKAPAKSTATGTSLDRVWGRRR